MSQLTELPLDWDYSGAEGLFEPEAISFLKFLCKKVYCEYEPNEFKPFENRVIDWLNNHEDEQEQKAFIALLLESFFIGRSEFEALYRLLLNSSISQWIIDIEKLSVSDKNLTADLLKLVNSSWICPITDSLRINSFLKVNNLQSFDVRPDWRSLKRFGDPKKIQKFIEENNVSRLILMEDFVGSGTQVSNVIKFASREFPHLEILLAPLVVCPDGDENLTTKVNALPNVSYRPVLVLPESSKFPTKKNATRPLHKSLHEVFESAEKRLNLGKNETLTGFRETGAQVIMYSNCPNNTLPVYHKSTDDWAPLFQRVTRQE